MPHDDTRRRLLALLAGFLIVSSLAATCADRERPGAPSGAPQAPADAPSDMSTHTQRLAPDSGAGAAERPTEHCEIGDSSKAHCLVTADFCARWGGCVDEGRCLVDRESNRCVTGHVQTASLDEAPFRARYLDSSYGSGISESCLELGRCHGREVSSERRIATEYSCRRWIGCTIDGRCRFDPDAGVCTARPGDCAGSELCGLHGKCHARSIEPRDYPGYHVCVATAADCQNTPRCIERDRCGFNESYSECEGFPSAYCRHSELCATEGRCASGGSSCYAALDRDCKASRACEKEGRCRALDGRCVTAAEAKEADEACRSSASRRGSDGQRVDPKHFTLVDGECHLAADAPCKALCEARGLCESKLERECTDDGVCSDQAYNDCRATKDAHCRGSKVCREEGHCAAGDIHHVANKCNGWTEPYDDCTLESASNVCVLASSYCKKQPDCKEDGDCSAVFMPGGYRACRPGSDADCRQSEACEGYGACALSGNPSLYDWCVPASEAHCSQSESCTEKGRNCSFDPESRSCT